MRKAFTLVEMLIVLAIIAFLTALIAFTLPGFQARSRAAKGGQAVQGWLMYARQRAQYEETPRGVRFYMEKNDAGWLVVRKAQYIERPADWNHGTPLVPNSTNDPAYVLVKQRQDIVNDPVMSEGQVEAGDYLELHGTGQPHVISAIGPSDPAKPNVIDKISLLVPLDRSLTSPTNQYRVMRATRVTGEEAMTMPDDVVIDTEMFAKYAGEAAKIDAAAPAITQGYFDVLFAPNGSVLNHPASKVILWIRVEKDTEYDNNPTLIVVTTNTGSVSAYDPVAGAPFSKVR